MIEPKITANDSAKGRDIAPGVPAQKGSVMENASGNGRLANATGLSPSAEPLCVSSAGAASIPSAQEALARLIAAVEFECPPIMDDVDRVSRARILLKCAREAKASADPDRLIAEPLQSQVWFSADYGRLGRVGIILPECNGGDDQFDADFEEILSLVRSVMLRRKGAAVAKPCAQGESA